MNTDFPDPTIIRQKIEITLPIYTFDLSNKIDIEQLIKKIHTLRDFFPDTTPTNVIAKNGWRSPYLLPYHCEQIKFDDTILQIQNHLKLINSFETRLVNFWTIIYNSEDYAISHNHYTLWDRIEYNTVLYLTDSDTPIEFETLDSKIEILPKKGMLLVMHPLTLHSVSKVKNDQRIVFVCNFGK